MSELMECGHLGYGKTMDNKPYCIMCDCDKVSDKVANLEGRIAKCSWCDNKKESSYKLPFFQYKPSKEYDEYYCGCGGWE